MTDSIKQTREFMLFAGQHCPDKPIRPYEDEHETMLKLRLGLCLEELTELAEAFGLKATFQKMLLEKGGASYDRSDYRSDYYSGTHVETDQDTGTYDTVAVLDALADMRVVADGTVLACGLDKVFPAAMDEIFRSNMSKFPESGQRVLVDERYFCEKNIPVSITRHGERWVILRMADGKVMKSTGYSPADLMPLLSASNTLEDQRQIEGTLANDDYSSDEELLANLIAWCPDFDPALLKRIIAEQRPTFFLEPLHTIDWGYYDLSGDIWNN